MLSRSTIHNNIRTIFLIIFTAFNLIQAANTGLIDDEAYYWLFSQNLDWGYFDHPPMTALFIKIGYALFHNELGVRLMMVAASTAAIILMEKTIKPKNSLLFYGIVLNLCVLNFAGFIAVPDIPLLFFVTLYFYTFRKFLDNTTILNSIVLGITMALMLYAKYHGILIILFSVLSIPRLFTKKYLYIAALTGIVLFVPHLVWQYNHGFPSVYYHLWDRNETGYQPNYTTDYIFGQIALAGPLLGWLFIAVLIIYKPKESFYRALKFSAIGIYLFFLYSSFNGRIEANWTIPAIASILIISYQYFEEKIQWHKLIYGCAIASFLLLLFVRVVMLFNILPVDMIPIAEETKNNKAWAESVKANTKGLPVLFLNSYQLPSKYSFYTKEHCNAINSPAYRQNNFNLWKSSINNTAVCIVSNPNDPNQDTVINTPKGKLAVKYLDKFTYHSDVLFYMKRKATASAGEIVLTDGIRYGDVRFPLDRSMLKLHLYTEGVEIKTVACVFVSNPDHENKAVTMGFEAIALPPGVYKAKIGLATSEQNIETFNSNIIDITVQ